MILTGQRVNLLPVVRKAVRAQRRGPEVTVRMFGSGAAVVLVCALGWVTSAAAETVPYIAGTAPSERPAGAPVITEFVQTPAWRAHALTGVLEPLPASLVWLEDQGAWFTPFIHPGMPGPYDIRGWHAAK